MYGFLASLEFFLSPLTLGDGDLSHHAARRPSFLGRQHTKYHYIPRCSPLFMLAEIGQCSSAPSFLKTNLQKAGKALPPWRIRTA